MSKGRVAPSVPAEPYLRKDLRNPEFAAAYLTLAAEEEVSGDFMWALRAAVEAYGGIGTIAKRAKLNRQQLYKTLSRDGNPEFRTLKAILEAAGFSLAVVPRKRAGKRAAGSGRGKNLVRARHAAQVEAA
jgi:probable addiction module antidote protein